MASLLSHYTFPFSISDCLTLWASKKAAWREAQEEDLSVFCVLFQGGHHSTVQTHQTHSSWGKKYLARLMHVVLQWTFTVYFLYYFLSALVVFFCTFFFLPWESYFKSNRICWKANFTHTMNLYLHIIISKKYWRYMGQKVQYIYFSFLALSQGPILPWDWLKRNAEFCGAPAPHISGLQTEPQTSLSFITLIL